MPDPDDRSEQLDGDVLGEQPFDDDPPGLADYPPERSLGAEDPSLFEADDLATRAELRRDAASAVDPQTDDVLLVDPAPTGALDHDETLTADAIDVDGDDPDVSAEESAVHVVPDDTVEP